MNTAQAVLAAVIDLAEQRLVNATGDERAALEDVLNTAQPDGHDVRVDGEPEGEFEAEPIEIASGAMINDLVRLFRDEMRMLPQPWHNMTEDQQKAALERADFRCTEAVRQAIAHIAGAERSTVGAVVESVTFKDGIKAVLSIRGSDPRRHEFADAVSQGVLVCLIDAKRFDDNKRPVPEPDQPGLPLSPEDNPEGAPPHNHADEEIHDDCPACNAGRIRIGGDPP